MKMLAFSYLLPVKDLSQLSLLKKKNAIFSNLRLARQISCSAELSMKKVL